MKVAIKIIILILSVTLAIGGVMIYAKTRVEPPTTLKQVNQFSDNLNHSYSSMKNAGSVFKEDSIYMQTIDRITVFGKETRLNSSEVDDHKEILLSHYSPIFLERCFAKFKSSQWNETDHKYMLQVSSRLKAVKYADKGQVLKNTTLDSLALVENIISNYRQAKIISRSTSFRGVSSAQTTISQARAFANDNYLSNCVSLCKDLNSVKNNIANSHFNYITNEVEKLSNYRYYSKQYYEETLIPQVDANVTEYDNKAAALYGTKKDVNSLWNKARGYYNDALNYYNSLNNNTY